MHSEYIFVPTAIQRRVISRMVHEPGLAVFVPPGMGKTACAYAAVRLLQRAKVVRRTLIISPLRPLYFTWPAENQKWNFNFSLAMLHGAHKKTELQRRDAEIYLINPEGIDWLEDNWRLAPKFEMLVVDESSRFRNTATRRHHLIKRLLPKFERRYIMTGTPAPNGLMNLFGQMYIMDGGLTLGRFLTHYRAEYFQPDWTGYSWVLQEGAAERIYDRLRPVSVAVDEKEYANLPRLIEPPPIQVELPPNSRKVYDELEQELFTTLEDGTEVSARNAGVLTMKLRQVANGGIYTGEETWNNLHQEKAEAVLDLVNELEGQPTIVAYEFHHDLERLRRVLPEAPWIGSGVSMKRQKEIFDDWNRGRLPVLLGQPQSMAHGLNMQETGRSVIWHSHTWDWENYDQLIRRIWRTGQKHTVFNYHIVARNTIDEDIILALSRKARTHQDLMGALKSGVRRRIQAKGGR